MAQLSNDQLVLIGELRGKEYEYQILARAYEKGLRFYINLGRFLDFLGVAISLFLLFFRYFAAKEKLTYIENLLSWIAGGLSVLFIILAIWRLIFAWSRH